MSSRTRCKITFFPVHIYCPVGTYSLVFISFGTNHFFFALSLRIFLFIIRSCSTVSRLAYPDSLYPPLVPCSRFSPRVEKSPQNAIFLAQFKIIHYLCSRIYAGGDMSVVKSVSHGTFYRVGSDILIAFIDALCLMYET